MSKKIWSKLVDTFWAVVIFLGMSAIIIAPILLISEFSERVYPADFPMELMPVYNNNKFWLDTYNEIGVFTRKHAPDYEQSREFIPSYYYCGPLKIEKVEHLFEIRGSYVGSGSLPATVITTDKGIFSMRGFTEPKDGVYVVFSGAINVDGEVIMSIANSPTAVELDRCPSEPKKIVSEIKYFWEE